MDTLDVLSFFLKAIFLCSFRQVIVCTDIHIVQKACNLFEYTTIFHSLIQNSRVGDDDDDLTSQIQGMGLSKASPVKANKVHFF